VAHGTVFPAKPSDLVAAGVNMLAHAAYLVWEGSPPSSEFQKRARGDFAGVPPASPAIEKLLQAMRDKDVALNPTLWIFAEGQAKATELTQTAINRYFVDNARAFKELEVTQASLQNNTKFIVPEGKSLTLIMDERRGLSDTITPIAGTQPDSPKKMTESK
jgi:hypothetical protein